MSVNMAMKAHEFLDGPEIGMGNLRLLTEAPARLGRLYQHARTSPFLMFTASRGDLSADENRQRNMQLVQILRGHDLGAIQVEGHWVEDTGPVTEMSFFVPLTKRAAPMTGDDLLQLGIALGRRFEQEAILYGDTQYVFRVGIRSGSLAIEGRVDQITTTGLGDVYSRIRNTSFQFKEGFAPYRVDGYRVPSGYISALGMSRGGLWPDSV
jgi:hypothetical protein